MTLVSAVPAPAVAVQTPGLVAARLEPKVTAEEPAGAATPTLTVVAPAPKARPRAIKDRKTVLHMLKALTSQSDVVCTQSRNVWRTLCA